MRVCCIGTGPSLTLDQIDAARKAGMGLFGANRVFEIVPDLEVMYAVNGAFWDYYYDEASKHPCQKWTTNKDAAEKYNLNWIDEKWGEGLCPVPNLIHHGHGSGYSLLGVAHKLGATELYLIGYDMKYPKDYDGYQQITGGDRHYFGEYPASMQHWPKRPWVDLLPLYKSINDQGLVKVVSCTPGSALNDFIPYMDIGNI
jgi:hypothetical protein